jgi:two-component system chemotaxis sensor kinase CheA
MTSTGPHIDNFKQRFREEAREILVDLESFLLELNEQPDNLELVGRVFRALHTLKGSGAMFEFDELAAFTHNLETAFDEVHNRRLAITSKLIDLSLAALDQIRAMVEESPDSTGVDRAICAEILQETRQLTGAPAGSAAGSKSSSPPAVSTIHSMRSLAR